MADIKTILETNGFRLKDHGAYWSCNAAFRGGDNPNAIQVYKNSGVWKDFVEDTEYLPFEALLSRVLGTNDNLVIKSALKNADLSSYNTQQRKNLLVEEKTYPDSCLKKLLPHYDFFLKRGISTETLKRFQAGLATGGKLYQRVIFPIRREDGKIHGFSGRKVTNDDRPKWLHNGKSSDWFYPFHSVPDIKDSILHKREVHVVESIGDALALYDAGVSNVLVSFGLNASPKFIARLSSLSPSKVFLSFNNDSFSKRNRGFEGALKTAFKLKDSVDFQRVYFAPPALNDFGAMSKDEIRAYCAQCHSMSHQDSSSELIDAGIEACRAIKEQTGRPNKSFEQSLRQWRKQHDFYYE